MPCPWTPLAFTYPPCISYHPSTLSPISLFILTSPLLYMHTSIQNSQTSSSSTHAIFWTQSLGLLYLLLINFTSILLHLLFFTILQWFSYPFSISFLVISNLGCSCLYTVYMSNVCIFIERQSTLSSRSTPVTRATVLEGTFEKVRSHWTFTVVVVGIRDIYRVLIFQ